MAWKLEGSYFESGSCEVVCPCTASFSLPATRDRCRVMLVFQIRQGEIEGGGVAVKLTGVLHPAGPELTVARATSSRVDASGIQYEGKAAFSPARFAWAA
jgi:hypothetical protein